jgi:hypothetical protein
VHDDDDDGFVVLNNNFVANDLVVPNKFLMVVLVCRSFQRDWGFL